MTVGSFINSYKADGVVRRDTKGRRIPDQNVWTGEVAEHILTFLTDQATGRARLSYEDPDPDDWEHGVLWLRHGQDRSGDHTWKTVNTPRTRAMMARNLCLVCSESAVWNDRIRWLLPQDPEINPAGRAITNMPPTCLNCTPEALRMCPRLREKTRIISVAGTRPFAVTGDIYTAAVGNPVPAVKALHRVNIPLLGENEPVLRFTLGEQPWVELYDMRDESLVLP